LTWNAGQENDVDASQGAVDRMTRLFNFLLEIVRSRMTRALGAYLVTVLLLSRVISDFFPAFGLPVTLLRALGILAILGLPLVAFLAWRFDVTPQGVVPKRRGQANDLVDAGPSGTDVGEWMRTRHNALGAGHVVASWTDAGGALQQREFFSPFILGRDISSDIRLTDERVSRIHAAVWAESGRWRVRDLGSSNGTWLDGERVSVSTLPANCKLRLHEDGPVVDLAVAAVEQTVVAFHGRTVRDN
jgi:hypothetical protein